MSRAALKKELSTMTSTQLVEVILDAYESRKEIKDYFEYFLNPDVARLTEKYRLAVSKEFNRSKWHRSKARISTINKLIKEYGSFSPGTIHEIEFMLYVVDIAALTEMTLTFTDTLYNGIKKLIERLLTLSDANLTLDSTIQHLQKLRDPEAPCCSRIFSRLLNETISSYKPLKHI